MVIVPKVQGSSVLVFLFKIHTMSTVRICRVQGPVQSGGYTAGAQGPHGELPWEVHH